MSASRARLWDHIYGFSERHLSIEGQELPTAGLSPAMMREVYRELARMKHSHAITVLLVEQNVREALAVADHVYSLVMGENDCHGPADEMRERLDEIVRGWMSRAGSGVVA